RDVRAIVGDVAFLTAKARAGEGTVGRLLVDEQMADDLAGALAGLDTLLAKVNDPKAGIVGALTSDPEAAEQLRVTINNIRDVTDSLRRSEGALGVLIN